MNAELQTLVDRLELLERQNRGGKLMTLAALVIAVIAIAWALLAPAKSPASRGLFSVIEANRFLLRDADGRVAGGMEVGRDHTVKLVLGGGHDHQSAAFLQVHGSGVVDLTMRGPDGGVRAAILATASPSLSLSANGRHSAVTAMAQPDGGGALLLTDAAGGLRFRAP